MTHRTDSSSNHYDNNEHHSSSYQRLSHQTSLSLSLNYQQANQDYSTHYNNHSQYPANYPTYEQPQAPATNYSNYYERTQSPGLSTNYYDRTQTSGDYGQGNDLSTQAVFDCWGPRQNVRSNDYRNPDNFSNPYNDLDAANQINRTQGFNAARGTFLRSIQDADGIDPTSLKQDHNYDLANLNRINSRESNISRYGGSFEDMQNLEQQKHQILSNESELKSLYYAPANTRISMGLAAIKTGNQMEMLEGQRLIEEAKEKRPEICADPRLQQMIDNAYQVGYRAHTNSGRPANIYEYPGTSNGEYQRTDAPQPSQRLPQEFVPRTETEHAPPLPPETTTVRPAPWEPSYPIHQPTPVPNHELPSRPVVAPTIVSPEAPARVHAEVPPPVVLPANLPDIAHPTIASVQSSRARITDAEAMQWLHSRYSHLTVESQLQNEREGQDAYQKAFDNTSYSFNPYSDSRDVRGASAGESARADKRIEYGNARNKELKDLYDTASQPSSPDSDLARQALITIIKNSAGAMATEHMGREISQECTAKVKELCAPGANGRSEMLEAIKVGLTESSHIPGGAKNNLMDGLELLVQGPAPEITKETAGRIALAALEHDIANLPRMGAPNQTGLSREECLQRQIRLIGMIDKFGCKSGSTVLQDLVKAAGTTDEVRNAAQQALADLQYAS